MTPLMPAEWRVAHPTQNFFSAIHTFTPTQTFTEVAAVVSIHDVDDLSRILIHNSHLQDQIGIWFPVR
jgi:hypothetical protein